MLFCEQLYVRLAPFLGKGIHCYKNNSVEVTFMDNYVEMDNEMDNEKIRCRGILHIVKKGDTLYKIAKKYGVPLSRVMYANPYVDVYNLQIGSEICVPVMGPRPPF